MQSLAAAASGTPLGQRLLAGIGRNPEALADYEGEESPSVGELLETALRSMGFSLLDLAGSRRADAIRSLVQRYTNISMAAAKPVLHTTITDFLSELVVTTEYVRVITFWFQAPAPPRPCYP